MAYILAVLATNRRGGFTASTLKAACAGAEEIEGVETEIVCLARFDFKPCLSSFWCARNQGQGCILPDDMGHKGDGSLFARVRRANGLLLATPVHTWGPSSLAHMFWERLYPFLYSDGLNGLPFGSMACATNQGFQRQAVEEMAKWAFCRGVRYLGDVAAHVIDREAVMEQARLLGRRVGEAAMRDQNEGRQKFTDEEKFAFYRDKPYRVLDPYLDNVTEGTFSIPGSLPERGGREFTQDEARELAQKAAAEFAQALELRGSDEEAAHQALMRASAFWTRATWRQYVEAFISKRDDVEPYRQLPAGENP